VVSTHRIIDEAMSANAKKEKRMSGKWQITHQESGVVSDVVAQVASLGTLNGPITFTIENVDTGETREVTAWDRGEVGERIASGEFDND
jgi:hypothetical protein